MLTFLNDKHELHHGKLEMFRGDLVPCFEVPGAAAKAVTGGARAAFALTRPPGHHAGADFFGGY